MKRLLLILLVLELTLTGCSVYKQDTSVVERPVTYGDPRAVFKYSLTTQQQAYLYNGSMKKIIMRGSADDVITLMSPKFYTEDKSSKTLLPSEFHCSIMKQGEFYDDKGELRTPYISYTFDYIKPNSVEGLVCSPIQNSLVLSMKSMLEYDIVEYESYAEYTADYLKNVNVVVKEKSSPSNAVLVGAKNDIRAQCINSIVTVNDTEYKLPMCVYSFKLPSNALFLMQLSYVSPDNKILYDTSQYTESLSKQFIKALESQIEIPDMLDEQAADFMQYLIYGDYSSYYRHVPVITEVKVVDDPHEELFTEESSVTKENGRITGVVDEPSEGGYEGYTPVTKPPLFD